MKTSHTPGPWKQSQHGASFVLQTLDGNQYLGTLDREADDKFANAMLIAAAPEMLEALEHALADLEALGGRVLKVKAAIKKAKGE